MLYFLFHRLQDVVSGFRLFNYITFRGAFAAVLAFLIATVVGPGIVATLRAKRVQGFTTTGDARVDAERERKGSVPTMGGVILLIGVALSGFLFARLDNPYTWIALLSFLAFGALGAADDWKKLTDPHSKGMAEKHKLLGQLAIAFVTISALYALGNADDHSPWLRGPSLKPSPYSGWVPRHRTAVGETWESLAADHLGDPGRGGGDRQAQRTAGPRRDPVPAYRRA